MALFALAWLAFAGTPAAPRISAAPVQDSPIVVHIAPRRGAHRLACTVDARRTRPCRRTTRLRLAPGRHTITAWAIGRSGRASRKARVAVVVPQRAPQPVSVGGEPVGIAAAESSLWVSGGSSGEAVRVDTATRTVTARVAVGGALGGIAATRGAVWVSVFDGGQVARIDPAAGSVVARVAVGGEPTAIAFDPSGMVWVGNLDGNLDRIDPATSQVTASLILPTGVSTLLPRGNLIWIGLQNGSLVTLDPATATLVGAPVAVAPDVDALAETPDGLWASTFDGLAARIDTTARRVVRRVRLPSRGGGVAYANGRVWVSAYDSGFAVALDPVSGVYLAAVHTGLEPRDSVVVGSMLWIADQGSGEVTPIAP